MLHGPLDLVQSGRMLMLSLLTSQQPSGSSARSLLAKAGQRRLERAEGSLCNELPRMLKCPGVLFILKEKLLSKDSMRKSCLALGCSETDDS